MFSVTSLGATVDKSVNNDADIPEFKIKLYNVIATRQYELPTSKTIGAVVFAESSATENEFDLIIKEHSRFPQRVNKLHPCYMSLQFPLLFVYGEDGYQKDMKLANVRGQSTKANKRMSMNMYYSYQIHDRLNHYSLLLRGGKLFQQYVVTAYCTIKESHLDHIRQKQDDIRNEYLLGIHDAILRGDRDGSDLGLRTVLSASFIGSPRYMCPDAIESQNTFDVNILSELCIPNFDTTLADLINFIYGEKTLQTPSLTDLQKKVIVCPKNESADMINTRVLSLLNRQQHVYLSLDEATPHGNDGGETELLYPPEYLNSLNFGGFPLHMLELKV
nr:DNA helicase [Tanacetum cinerariifolium]